MIVQNKWTGKLYDIIDSLGNFVILVDRENGNQIKISKSEYAFTYRKYEGDRLC